MIYIISVFVLSATLVGVLIICFSSIAVVSSILDVFSLSTFSDKRSIYIFFFLFIWLDAYNTYHLQNNSNMTYIL